MSFYRTLVAIAVTFSLSTAIFAADEITSGSADSTSQVQSVPGSDSTQANPANVEQTKLSINTASAKELSKLNGLNMRKSQSIVSYRKKHGDFKSLDELKQVPGFQKMKDNQLQNIQDQLSL